jgi:hypothetical protein
MSSITYDFTERENKSAIIQTWANQLCSQTWTVLFLPGNRQKTQGTKNTKHFIMHSYINDPLINIYSQLLPAFQIIFKYTESCAKSGHFEAGSFKLLPINENPKFWYCMCQTLFVCHIKHWYMTYNMYLTKTELKINCIWNILRCFECLTKYKEN